MPAETSDKTIAGRYVLRRPLGRGAMGVVWLASDSTLHRDVAIKEIELPEPIDAGEQDALRARVMREARAAARLSHPAAVTVFDVVEEDGRPWIVMELVTARTLEEIVRADGPLDPAGAAVMGLDIVDALAAAHRAGIVHRDVKPANVMVDEAGHAKLADFGIASLKDDPKITATGLVLGSPSFMAPEQAHSQGSGPAADMWSFGATLYFAVEGRPPFDKGAAIPTLTSVIEEELPPPARAGMLAPLITGLMSKDPSARPDESATRAALVAASEGVAPAVLSSPAPSSPAPSRMDPAPARDRSGLRGTLLGVAVGIVLIGSIVLLVVSITSRSDPETAASSPERTAPAETGPPRAAVPGSWARYEDPSLGWSVATPPEWEVVPQSIDSTSVDFRDPGSGAYLRVDWITPPGDSAVAAWEQQSEAFAASHSDYVNLGIAPASFRGWEAATWEFTYTESGAELHALDLGFVIDDEYGFALYWQTHEEDWESFQNVFKILKRSFEAPE